MNNFWTWGPIYQNLLQIKKQVLGQINGFLTDVHPCKDGGDTKRLVFLSSRYFYLMSIKLCIFYTALCCLGDVFFRTLYYTLWLEMLLRVIKSSNSFRMLTTAYWIMIRRGQLLSSQFMTVMEAQKLLNTVHCIYQISFLPNPLTTHNPTLNPLTRLIF